MRINDFHFRSLAVGAFLLLASGCGTTTARLYPHSGPLKDQRAVPTVIAKAHGTWTGSHGRCEVFMPDGEVCEGEWSALRGGADAFSTVSLFGTYGSVFGYSATTVRSANWIVRAVCMGPTGTTVEMELISDGTNHGFGIATDSNGNLYRAMF